MKKVEVVPTAKISVKKSVLKKYQVKDEDVYFLKKDAEFEIELFNPLRETLLCKIFFNGKDSNDSGLVIYPGQRIFLERHLETDKKLIFNTYVVEDTEEAANATQLNGLVEVKFYKENYTDWGMSYNDKCKWVSADSVYINPNIFTSTSVSTVSSFTPTFITNTSFNGNISLTGSVVENQNTATIETGRVGKGNKSNQAFIETYESFYSYPSFTVKFKILPDSIKLKTEEDFKYKKYCVECGSKVGSTDKFCSQCGTKI